MNRVDYVTKVHKSLVEKLGHEFCSVASTGDNSILWVKPADATELMKLGYKSAGESAEFFFTSREMRYNIEGELEEMDVYVPFVGIVI